MRGATRLFYSDAGLTIESGVARSIGASPGVSAECPPDVA